MIWNESPLRKGFGESNVEITITTGINRTYRKVLILITSCFASPDQDLKRIADEDGRGEYTFLDFRGYIIDNLCVVLTIKRCLCKTATVQHNIFFTSPFLCLEWILPFPAYMSNLFNSSVDSFTALSLASLSERYLTGTRTERFKLNLPDDM